MRQLCLCLAAKPALPRRSALHEAVAGQTRAFAQARPASLNSQVTAARCRQSSLARADAPSALPAVRPTAAACGRVARPLLRPGSWGRAAAPYNDARSSLFPRCSRRCRPAAALLDKVDCALCARRRAFSPAGKRQYAGESAFGGPGNTGVFPSPSSPRAALPGRRGPARRRSLAGRIAAARPAIGGAVRSAQGAGRREHALYDNACIIVSCPFPGVLLALRPLRS